MGKRSGEKKGNSYEISSWAWLHSKKLPVACRSFTATEKQGSLGSSEPQLCIPYQLDLDLLLSFKMLTCIPWELANNKERREGTNGGIRNALKQSIYVFWPSYCISCWWATWFLENSCPGARGRKRNFSPSWEKLPLDFTYNTHWHKWLKYGLVN